MSVIAMVRIKLLIVPMTAKRLPYAFSDILGLGIKASEK